MMLGVYTFVFREVFRARWTTQSEGKIEFALVLFCGLILFNVFGDCVSRSPGLMIENANYIKKVVFPLEILPWVVILVALFDALTALIPFAIFYGFILGVPPITAVLFPIVVVPLALMTLGLSWFFSSLGVFLRDINQFVRLVVMALLFGSAIFFPPELIPEPLRAYSYVNPLVWIIETARGLLFWGRLPDYMTLIEYTLVSWLMAWMGYVWFMKTRKGFADVV
jgi:lipopolysaccharide transport system permease protein